MCAHSRESKYLHVCVCVMLMIFLPEMVVFQEGTRQILFKQVREEPVTCCGFPGNRGPQDPCPLTAIHRFLVLHFEEGTHHQTLLVQTSIPPAEDWAPAVLQSSLFLTSTGSR